LFNGSQCLPVLIILFLIFTVSVLVKEEQNVGDFALVILKKRYLFIAFSTVTIGILEF